MRIAFVLLAALLAACQPASNCASVQGDVTGDVLSPVDSVVDAEAEVAFDVAAEAEAVVDVPADPPVEVAAEIAEPADEVSEGLPEAPVEVFDEAVVPADATADAVPDVAEAEAVEEVAEVADAAPAPHPDTDRLKALLDVAVIGLLYTSESDYPFVVIVVPGAATTPITTDNVKDRVAPVYVPRPDSMSLQDRIVEERTLDDVFEYYITPQDWWTDYEKDRYPRFQALYDILKNQVHDIKVFRVGPYDQYNGMSPDIDVFFVGASDEGDLVGLWTVSIET